jgi:outer membrane protein assembly factor BamA
VRRLYGMARPSNQDIYNRTPELEAGSEAAVATVQAQYPTGKIVEAEVDETTGTCEVTVGVQEGEVYKIYEVKLDASGAVTSTEERPNVPPGHHKNDKPLKERKPGVRTS